MRAAALGGTDDLIDLAAGQPWHRLDAEARSPDSSGTVRLQVDLGLRFPIHAIARAGEVSGVAVSDDGQVWSEPEGEGVWARHVRVTARRPIGRDAPAVQVWCTRSSFDLITLRHVLGASFDMAGERPESTPYITYSLVTAERLRSHALAGLALYECGAFGNCLIQCLLIIGIARNLNLKTIKLPAADRSEVIALSEPVTLGGITFIPGSAPLPPDGSYLSGMYFDLGIQQLAGTLGPEETREIVRTYIRPLFNRLPARIPEKPDDALLIHIRSGDIFGTWVAPEYPQPPLAFYRMVIDRLLAEGRIASIKLVFENRLNPVIPALEAWITARGVPFSTQSGALTDDVAALMNGRYLVFGLGTFGPGVCQLSDRIEQVFYFASGWPQHFKSIPTIGKVVEVLDVAGGYTKVGEWDNSPERRALMLDYPIENLAFDDT